MPDSDFSGVTARRTRRFQERAEILARLFEISFILNGAATKQFVLTEADEADARLRLQAQYPSEAIHLITARLAAVGWRWSKSAEYGPEIFVRDETTGADVQRGEYRRWTTELIAAARQVAAGRPVPSLLALPNVAGWKFKDVRRILRQDRGEGFVLQEVLNMFPEGWHAELLDTIPRLTALGLLQERSQGWWRITSKGVALRNRSQGQLSTTHALALIDEATQRIAGVNTHADYAYKVDAAVVFGSVLENRDRVGDIDLAIKVVQRYPDENMQDEVYRAALSRAPSHQRTTLLGQATWPRGEIERAIVGSGRGQISLRDIGELENLFRSEPTAPKYRVILGSWQPPKRPRPHRVPVSALAEPILKDVSRGVALLRERRGGSWDDQRNYYSIGDRAVDPDAVRQLEQLGAFIDREPSPYASLVTDEWVLTAAGHAALERGFFRVSPRNGRR